MITNFDLICFTTNHSWFCQTRSQNVLVLFVDRYTIFIFWMWIIRFCSTWPIEWFILFLVLILGMFLWLVCQFESILSVLRLWYSVHVPSDWVDVVFSLHIVNCCLAFTSTCRRCHNIPFIIGLLRSSIFTKTVLNLLFLYDLANLLFFILFNRHSLFRLFFLLILWHTYPIDF